ncbi:hypothetical protein IAT38_002977 [Cryptococcus sp. DSM 104549]
MSLADQRSTQRLIGELMEDLRSGSPRGESPTRTSPTPTNRSFPKPKHVERVRRGGSPSQGHRRTYSSPGSATSESEARARTLSGGTFGKTLGRDGLMSDVETLRSGMSGKGGVGGSATASTSPVLGAQRGERRVELPLRAARANDEARGSEGSASASAEAGARVDAGLRDASKDEEDKDFEGLLGLPPPPPSVQPITALPSPPLLSPSGPSTLPPPLVQSPPLVTLPDVRVIKSSLPPPTSPLPPTPKTPRSPGGSVHPFAAVVAMMEEGNSPSKRRSQRDLKGDEGPGSADKGKGREDGEGPPEGRQQKGRRGFVGPGGIIHKIASHHSLSKLRGSQSLKKTYPEPVINTLPPSPPDTAPLSHTPMSATTPTSTTFLRPAPPPPTTPQWARPVFAPSSALTPSPSPSRQSLQPSFEYAPQAHNGRLTSHSHHSVSGRSGRLTASGLPEPDVEMVEIPRFKKRDLNLGMVRKSAVGQRVVWLVLGGLWLINGLLSLFFDVNVIYTLVQCTIHPSFDSNSGKTWEFATAAYAVLWALSTFVVWLGWELGYEFWRRWRLDRPAIEPIYLSLPASLHLSLKSYNHFLFLLHIRTSPLGTPYARDIIPETCHFLLQLLPGLIPLLPRAAIAVVVLISFWKPAADVQAPYGGSVDQTAERDPNFFRSDAPGQLTGYSKGVLMAFTVYIAFRLAIVIASGIGLWMFSGRPLGGLFGHRVRLPFTRPSPNPPSTPRKRRPKSSTQPRDPNLTHSPQKSWIDHENAFDWAWRERTRARVQDAFELCIVRFDGSGGTGGTFGREGRGSFRGEVPWGRGGVNASRAGAGGEMEMLEHGDGHTHTGDPKKEQAYPAYSTGEFIAQFVEGKNESYSTLPKPRTPEIGPTRPESTLDPTTTAGVRLSHPQFLHARPAASRADTAATDSTADLFYTPMGGNTPVVEKSRSTAEGLPADATAGGSPAGRGRVPPSAFKRPGVVTEFGMKEERTSEDSGEADDESTGLLSATASPSPRHSVLPRDRSASNASRLSRKLSGGVSNASGATGTGTGTGSSSLSSSRTRRRASTTSHPHPLDFSRARSSSITMLKESLSNAAVASGTTGLVRRARSGTVLSSAEGKRYRRMEGEESEEELADDGPATPRSTHDQTMGLGVPFGLAPDSSPARRTTPASKAIGGV